MIMWILYFKPLNPSSALSLSKRDIAGYTGELNASNKLLPLIKTMK